MSLLDKSVARSFLPPHNGVTVRLYNPGFGECLLLAFPGTDGKARYMLIDCGVHPRDSDGKQRIEAVAADIAVATNKHLHWVVITHQHSDHLSGFDYAREIFDDIEIENLWLPWTADPYEDDAVALQEQAKEVRETLNALVKRLGGHKGLLGKALREVLDFEYYDEKTDKFGKALDYLRSGSRKKRIKSISYLGAGEVPALPDVDGIRIYILGPTRGKDADELDNGGKPNSKLMACKEREEFTLAALAAAVCDFESEADRELEQRNLPFDRNLAIAPEEISLEQTPKNHEGKQTTEQVRARKKVKEFFWKYYGFGDAPKEGPEWRRIDCDWLESAEQLTLQQNDRINNTSLVLAIELKETRKVLLFAADAQTGSWPSWEKLSLQTEGENEGKLTVGDLLRRTILYKVGHHGSCNAALNEHRLHLLNNPDLVAMIPVDADWAANQKPPWEFPALSIMENLIVKTRGRILRSDKIPPPEKLEEEWQTLLQDLDWESKWQDYFQRLDWDSSPEKLWVQFTITGEAESKKEHPSIQKQEEEIMAMEALPEKPWTFMVYMAGDNNLESYGGKDLIELKKTGSSQDVNVIAQLDCASTHKAKRYYLRAGSDVKDDEVAGFNRAVNCGDPKELTDFIEWGVKNYPANNYALILWNHGQGWDDTDLWQNERYQGFKKSSKRRLRRALFPKSVRQALAEATTDQDLRAILSDDDAKDFLDNIEMKQVLADAAKMLGRKLDLLGMDACLMSMAEVGYQMRQSVEFTVGSEDSEPGEGWPYDLILTKLVEKPEMNPHYLSRLIVGAYLSSYAHTSRSVTQSACNLAHAESLAFTIANLAKALKAKLGDDATLLSIVKARSGAQSFDVRDNIDLVDFCERLAKNVAGTEIAQCCQQVIQTVRSGYVFRQGYKGDRLKNSNGVAIYFPEDEVSPLYTNNLDFSPKTGWDEFLKAYIEAKRSS